MCQKYPSYPEWETNLKDDKIPINWPSLIRYRQLNCILVRNYCKMIGNMAYTFTLNMGKFKNIEGGEMEK